MGTVGGLLDKVYVERGDRVHKGEVLGVGGLAGHGHRQLFFMLFGAEKPSGGTIAVESEASPDDSVPSWVCSV